MLASNLPPESPYVVAVSNGESIWGLTEQLLAIVADTLSAANYQRAGGKGTRPRPLPRPGVGAKKERIAGGSYSPQQIRAFLDGTDGRRWVEDKSRSVT